MFEALKECLKDVLRESNSINRMRLGLFTILFVVSCFGMRKRSMNCDKEWAWGYMEEVVEPQSIVVGTKLTIWNFDVIKVFGWVWIKRKRH